MRSHVSHRRGSRRHRWHALRALWELQGGAVATVEVTVGGFVGTGLDVFSFDAPVGSDVLRNAPLTGDGSVTVTGLGFGLFEYTATAALGSAACSTSSWSSASSVVCQASDYYGYAGYVEVTVGAMSGTGAAVHTYDPGRAGVFSFDAPVGSGVMLNAPHSGDGSVTVSGLSFGSSTTQRQRRWGLHHAAHRLGASGTSVACQMSSVDARLQTAELTVGGVVGTGYGVFSFDAPVASFVELNMAHSFGGSVTVTRAELPVCGVHSDGAAAVWGVLDDIVELGDDVCSALRVRCGMRRGAVYDVMRAVQVTVGGVVGTSTEAFSFDAPVASFVRLNMAHSFGGSVTVTRAAASG